MRLLAIAVALSALLPLEARADIANFDMDGKTYTKFMYQNDATKGCLSLSNPFWVDNIGGHNEWKNIDLVHLLCSIMDKKLGRAAGESAKLITYVADRAGHWGVEIARDDPGTEAQAARPRRKAPRRRRPRPGP